MKPPIAHQFVTVIHMDTPLGKLYSTNAGEEAYDAAAPLIRKTTAYNTGAGWARTYYCPDVDTLGGILNSVQADPHKAIILGYVKGTEPVGDNTAYGEDYRLISKKAMILHFNGDATKIRKPQKIDGTLHATRSVEMFSRSTWFAFDLDLSPDMPDELVSLIENTPYVELLEDLCPQLKGCSHLAVSSASSRVSINGKSLSKENAHIYYQCKYPSDLPRYAASMLVRSLETRYGYINPARDIQTNEIDPTRNGAPSSIFDRAVFSTARIMFEGSPRLEPTDPHTLNGTLALAPSRIVPHNDNADSVDTLAYLSPSTAQQSDARMSFSNSSKGFQVTNHTDLLPHTKIEVKDIQTNEESILTMLDFVNGDTPRYRAQNPFKPSSRSWSAFLSKENHEGEECLPYLHSVEFGNFIYNDVVSQFENFTATNMVEQGADATRGAAQQIPTVPVPVSAHTDPTNVLSAPPPPPNVAQLTLPSVAITQAPPKTHANFNTGVGVHTYPLPSDVDEDQLATVWVDRYFGDGGQNLLIGGSTGGKGMSFWADSHWEKVEPETLKTLMLHCAIEGGVKRITASKMNSVFALSVAYARRTSKVEPLPSHMIPVLNGILDFSTGLLIPHTREYYYTDVKPFNYDPDERGEGLLAKVVNDASRDDPEFVRQFKQLGGYLIAGGDNIAQKIIYLDGIGRAGKSLVSQTITAIAASTLNLELEDLPSKKKLQNVPGKALIYDDDALTPSYKARGAVTGIIKKLTGGASMDIEQLYTADLFECYLNPKILLCCNGQPELDDPNGAIHDRTEILSFDVTHAGREDFSLGDRMRQPTELSASLNYLLDGYQDLLKYNGYHSIERFTGATQKHLKFVRCETSLTKLAESLSRAHQLMPFFKEQTLGDERNRCTILELEKRIRDWALFEPGMEHIKKYGRNALRREVRGTLLRLGYIITKVWDGTRSVEGVKGLKLVFKAQE